VAKDGQQAFGKVEFVYGLSGGLLGQYNASGAAAEEIVWLGDLPVGTIQGGAAYSIAPDHLGAPHQIVNSANGQVWFWNHDPFGNGAPTAAAGFAHRLRFPGQIYDAESGLHSNGHRDYDPRLGRYVESDPIGLEGGINTYAYAGNNPVSAIDPFGLDPKSKEDDPDALPEIDIAAQQPKPKELKPKEPTPPAQCLTNCFTEQFGIHSFFGAGAIGAGLPLLEKPMVLGGSSAGTSLASKLLAKAFPQRLPFRVPAPTWNNPWAQSVVVGRIAGRWVPVFGWGIMGYDAAQIGVCTYQCMTK
jgi:RHS repeat-associated protein